MEATHTGLLSSPPVTQDWILMRPIPELCALRSLLSLPLFLFPSWCAQKKKEPCILRQVKRPRCSCVKSPSLRCHGLAVPTRCTFSPASIMDGENNNPLRVTLKKKKRFKTFSWLRVQVWIWGDFGCWQAEEWDCFASAAVSTAHSSGFKQTYERIARANRDDGMFSQRWLILLQCQCCVLLPLSLFNTVELVDSAAATDCVHRQPREETIVWI